MAEPNGFSVAAPILNHSFNGLDAHSLTSKLKLAPELLVQLDVKTAVGQTYSASRRLM